MIPMTPDTIVVVVTAPHPAMGAAVYLPPPDKRYDLGECQRWLVGCLAKRNSILLFDPDTGSGVYFIIRNILAIRATPYAQLQAEIAAQYQEQPDDEYDEESEMAAELEQEMQDMVGQAEPVLPPADDDEEEYAPPWGSHPHASEHRTP